MNHVADFPLWMAWFVAAFLIIGAGLTLIGSFGLYRLRSFYDRIHAPTLGTSWGTAAIVLASIIYFSVLQSRPVFHEILIGIFVTITTPVTFMLLGRAALYRDRSEKNPEVPAMDSPKSILDELKLMDKPESVYLESGERE
ncbi:monovalent cation/H(+) antiporter subunit G [Nitrosomonas sp. Nm132]|jgi:multicomponent K+:H+ antiporter subunit G|uniref:monovalent cation/H(+) antiporter subunit G n=1 Tax=Nitrosomonas sp. Nm132 TaxID=1881053 RepID=UPI00088EA0F9|nr:monovalent cation/H(+) antiporter subunit G [Nitrosomonas sp. Nm132]SDH81645.1 multicomponent K+:H+ antiporter subunit G [Nitrosomonas sp. Nm132]